MKGGCDGTLAEDEEHRRKSGRGCESKVERDNKMSHRKKREGNEEIFYYRYSESFLINPALMLITYQLNILLVNSVLSKILH